MYIVEIWKILDWVRFCERALLHKHPSHRYTTHVSHEKNTRPPEGQMVAGPPDTGGAEEAGRRQNKVWSILLAMQMENTGEISINHKYQMISMIKI